MIYLGTTVTKVVLLNGYGAYDIRIPISILGSPSYSGSNSRQPAIPIVDISNLFDSL
jgi:hypothetical protein